MPTIEGKQAGVWINDYVKNAGKSEGVAKAVRGGCIDHEGCKVRNVSVTRHTSN